MAILPLLVVLVVALALVSAYIEHRRMNFGRHTFLAKLRVGAPIVYRMVETSTRPSRDAIEVHPAERGELYYCVTRKFWRVEEILEDGSIVARTPLMEHHHLRRNDPNLRRASLVERLRYAAEFPHLA